jgi:SAM-dependent methyltransferase
VIAHSVFTHILEADAAHYLREFGRILRPGGVARATFFLFDKRGFPMMEPHRNALYTDPFVLTDAVILDREWLRDRCERAGLAIVGAVAPEIRGYHWVLTLAPAGPEVEAIELPADEAPLGEVGGPATPPDESAVDHARAAARERERADKLAAELAQTRARLEYLQRLPPIRLARALKQRLGR